jgi:hypothetical protein
MPRTTRAAARAQETDNLSHLVFEDDEPATRPAGADEASQPTAHPRRPIFGELTGNNIPTIEPQEQTITIYAMPTKKVKGRKGRPATNKNKLELKVRTENDNRMLTEVMEDENHSDSSDAADAAAEELRRNERPPETFQVPMDTKRPRTPPSAAAREATSTLLRGPNKAVVAVQGIPPNTPQFDPQVHKEEPQAEEDPREDSFVENIATRSPAKATPQTEEQKEDSFLDAIIARSPTKPIPRIEDSVTEMDALEDAIEKVAEILPVLEERNLESPTATRDVVKEVTVPSVAVKKTVTTTLAPKSGPKSGPKAPKVRPPPPTKPASGPQRPSTSRPSTMRVKPTTRPSVLPNQPRAVSVGTPSSSSLDRRGAAFSASPAKAQPNTAQKIRKLSNTRSLSTSKPGFVPAKSTKATTTSTFSLPGETIAAKLKAQREERQKREEEAAAKQAREKVVTKATTAVKTRPRLSTAAAPVIQPRETKTSRARQSLMVANTEKRSTSGGSNKETEAPAKRATQQPSKSPVKAKELVIKKRPSRSRVGGDATSLTKRTDVEKTGISGADSVRANSAIRRTGGRNGINAAQRESTGHSPSSRSEAGVTKATMNKTDLVSQKGKEVSGRDKLEKVVMEKARREKEEAAKKARADAAERGRAASREWAEKQKRKLAAAAAAEAAKKEQTATLGGAAIVVEAA